MNCDSHEFEIDRAWIEREFLNLVRIPSPSGQEGEIREYVKAKFKELGLNAVDDQARKLTGYGFDNLVVDIDGNCAQGMKLCFFVHLDTVTPAGKFEPVVRDGYVYSDGKCVLGGDDKAGVAALFGLAKLLNQSRVKRNHVKLYFTVGEELNLQGVRGIEPASLRGFHGVVADCSREIGHIVLRAPSYHGFRIDFIGRAAHAGAYPEVGINAVAMAARAINSVTLGRVDDETTRNMIIIQGGERVNIVPEKVIVRGEVRSLVHEKMIREVRKTEKMAEKAAEDFGGRVKWVVEEEFRGFYIQKTADIVKLAAAAYEKTGIEPEYFSHTGASDANILNEKGIQSIVISIASYKCHTTGEYYKLSNLSLLAQSLGEMVRLAAFM